MQTTTRPPLAVFVVRPKKRPKRTALTVNRDAVFPATVTDEGQTFYFSNADLVANTITYVSVDPRWQD